MGVVPADPLAQPRPLYWRSSPRPPSIRSCVLYNQTQVTHHDEHAVERRTPVFLGRSKITQSIQKRARRRDAGLSPRERDESLRSSPRAVRIDMRVSTGRPFIVIGPRGQD